MSSKYKHKTSGKTIIFGGQGGESMQRLIGTSNITLGEIVKGDDWEQVKDYTILQSCYNKDYKHLGPNIHEATKFCGNNYCFPWSVKKEDTQEVFIVGDDYILKDGTKTKIERFSVVEDDIMLITENNVHILLEFWKKPSKVKLFTTFDDVDIFEGDFIWRVNGLLNVLSPIIANKIHKDWNEKWFSSEKAAYDYCKLNKVLFSAQDIIDHPNILRTSYDGEFSLDQYPNLVKLINSKFNL